MGDIPHTARATSASSITAAYPAGDPWPRISGQQVVASFVSDELDRETCGSGHLIALCAEPDMGKTTLLRRICQDVEAGCGLTKYVDLDQASRKNVAAGFGRACREMAHYLSGHQTVLLAFDNIPALDEDEVLRVVRSLRRFTSCGGNVLLGLCPEGEALVEELPEARCYRSRDLLLVSGPRTLSVAGQGEDLGALTHGIPSLVRATMPFQGGDVRGVAADPRYCAALSEVTGHALRHDLIREEREVRLALVELGGGMLSDLDQVVGQVDQALLESLSVDAPLFGLDLSAGTFSCAGLGHNECLAQAMQRLRPLIASLSHVSASVALLLAARGDFRRAGIVAMASSPRERASLVLGYPTEFVNAGFGRMVEGAVSVAAQTGETRGVAEARLALACLVAPAREYRELREGIDEADAGAAFRCVADFREALGGATPRARTPETEEPQEGLRASMHAAGRALRLLEAFRFADAYAYLLGSGERLGEPDFATSVLWAEYLLSMGLSGNAPTQEDMAGLGRALRFAEDAGLPFLRQVLSTIGPLVSVLAGDGRSSAAVESCAQGAAIMGMGRVQAACLMASAVADQRSGFSARAFVRLGQAADLAARSRCTHLAAACLILRAAVKRSLGERVAAEELLAPRMPARLSAVGRFLAAVVEGPDAARLDVMGKVGVKSCPAGTAWLVRVLANDFGELSSRFRDVVPRPWVEEAQRGMAVAGELLGGPSDGGARLEVVGPAEGSFRVDISLLGGFRVSVNGVPVDESRLERRRAKSLLALLAVMPEHRARRYQVMESVWPELDFHDARQRMYEATSVLRSELITRQGLTGVDPFVANRNAGTIGLDESCVRCDVDDFEGLARAVLSSLRLRPSEVVSHGAELVRMYQGDLFVPQVDGAGVMSARRAELRRLFADVMTLASAQALALGKAQTAVRYAENACEADGLREDAELCLVRALSAAGRRLDAERSFRAFADRLIREERRPPSRELREAYHEVVSGGEELVLHVGSGGERRAASA